MRNFWGVANSTILWPNNWPLHWPFWSDFFTEGVVLHDQLGNAKKAKTKMGAIYVSPRIVAEEYFGRNEGTVEHLGKVWEGNRVRSEM